MTHRMHVILIALYKYEITSDATVTHGAIPNRIDSANGNFASWKLL